MSKRFCIACLEPISGLSVCTHCGWNPNATTNPIYLSPGFSIYPPYQVARVLGHGGFGITYLGWDANLQTKVAIKEYLPHAFARRHTIGGQVIAKSEDSLQHFNLGLNSFLEEARVLAKFQQHPGIVSVLTFFRALGTGYMVMEYVEGETLKSYLQQRGRLQWGQTLDIFMQIMDALRAVHHMGLLHRDIAPDNIYLCGDGRIKLLDFGAARDTPGKFKPDLVSNVIIVKQGFAPEEQYRNPGDQGPWSDVYSLAASMYYCLTGLSPPDAMERMVEDTLKPPSFYAVVIPFDAEQALMRALAISSLQRPQTIESLQNQLLSPSPLLTPVTKKSTSTEQPRQTPISSPSSSSSETSSIARIFHGRRGWFLGLSCVILWLIVFQQSKHQVAKIPAVIEQIEATEPAVLSDVQTEEDFSQLEMERLAAEEFKQQQAAAIKRLDENSRQQKLLQPINPDKPDTRQAEHMRSLCAEWGATMDCENSQ